MILPQEDFTTEKDNPASGTKQTSSQITSSGITELLLVESKLSEILGKADGIIKETCANLLNAGGKRIRPLLTIHSGMCFGPLKNTTIYAAVAAELIHMASLIHDDVIDNSAMRRGQQTINSKFNNQVAVLTGDYVFAEAFSLLSSYQLTAAMKYLVEAIQAMCEGEVNQAGELFYTDIDEEIYFRRIANKTGILIANCCKCGAVTAGANEESITYLGEFGLNLGYAYQIIDDLLDFTASCSTAGKPVGADLINGNITLPIIYLMRHRQYGDWLKELIENRKIGPEEFRQINHVLFATDCLEKTYETALHCIKKGLNALENLPASSSKKLLSSLTDQILHRQK